MGHSMQTHEKTYLREITAMQEEQALRGFIAPLVEVGQSQRAIAAALNDAGHRTERGSLWNHKTIGRVIERLCL